MKTHGFYLRSCAGVLFFSMLLLFSCSKVEPGTEQEEQNPNKEQLVLTATLTEVEKGKEVTFATTANGKAVEADIFVKGIKIVGAKHIFDALGEYEVVAKKDGYKESEKVVIKAYEIAVYLAGYEREKSIDVAKYWKNGEAVALTAGMNSQANSIFVADGDVYVAGHNGGKLQYWKNGVAVRKIDFNTIRGEAYSVFVDKKDVYVTGWEYDSRGKRIAHYWKNGNAVPLAAGSASDVLGLSIFVDNGDVYVAGYKDNGTRNVAQYWKNGVAVALTDGKNDAFATSIVVESGIVYVAGYEYNGSFITGISVAKYWKNGTVVNLSDGSRSVGNSSIFVDNGDVYVAARGYSGYWKNGVAVPFSNSASGNPHSIFVDNKNVYLSGNISGGGQERVAFWKNGDRMAISPGTQYASGNSIFVTRSFK